LAETRSDVTGVPNSGTGNGRVTVASPSSPVTGSTVVLAGMNERAAVDWV
jgi:hypothetical protein